ncbi:phosphoacetylglucosamine mutase-like gene [Leishmania tarentolae]|uniref:Phosphoacetylglucosamine mutase n=1 Tax=Leishmania tarentolae TaxID=5689 RepID=A0A640KAD4_LEITA|nr:phosphoacetylglucosamine mutase-like gene [Leishmania tarentolae]
MEIEQTARSNPHAIFTSIFFDELKIIIDSEFPLRHDPMKSPLTYGTAGFRFRAALLPPVAARVSMIAALRSVYCQGKRATEGYSTPCTVGVIITASHNPYLDNGFKIIDTDGGMLTESWEDWCTRAANAISGRDLEKVMLDCLAHDPSVFEPKKYSYCCVHFCRDTRPSGEEIVNAGLRTLHLLRNTTAVSYPPASTPYMHFAIRRANVLGLAEESKPSSYYSELLAGFEDLYRFASSCSKSSEKKGYSQQLVVDCANGIGSVTVKELINTSKQHSNFAALATFFELHQVDCEFRDETMLNTKCGADYAKLHASPSPAMSAWPSTCPPDANPTATHFYSLDGDADRVVAFLYDPKRDANWVLLDGDRISILYAMLLNKWLGEEQMKALDVAVVQTAYANGASTEFLEKQLHMQVYTSATGVKNLHPIAHARDVGIYFEANGHGTVLISERVLTEVASTGAEKVALFAAMRRLMSQCCGDAIADILMCEVALKALNMTFQDWADLYVDRPCKQIKVTAAHRSRITNTVDERRALSPAGMQDEIDAAVSLALSRCKAARAFVRPSGTEPVVRVYAEATDSSVCESLSADVAKIVEAYCS